jgi:hypothetical protein
MNETTYSTGIDLTAGANVISFSDDRIARGKEYSLTVTDGSNKAYSIPVILR